MTGMSFHSKGYGGHRRDPEQVKRHHRHARHRGSQGHGLSGSDLSNGLLSKRGFLHLKEVGV